jgi:hypothetical protein
MMKMTSLARVACLRLLIPVSLIAVFAVLPAYATIMHLMNVETLTRRSSEIFHGQVTSIETVWNADRSRIYTRISVRVEELLKGTLNRSQIVTVTQLGGELDGLRLDYPGRAIFSKNENVVLFTKRGNNNDLVIIGLKQGKMTVEGGEVRRDLSGLTLVKQRQDGRGLQQITTPGSLRMTLGELRNRIAATR